MKTCPDGTHCQNEYLIEELEHKLDLCKHVAMTMTELHDQRVGDIYKLTAELAALREQVRWIPVSERLPEKFQRCIVLDKNKLVHNWMHDDALLPLFAEYTHWMPLPKPSEGE